MSGAGCYYEVHDCEIETTPLLFSRQPLSEEYLNDFWQAKEETTKDDLESTDCGVEGKPTGKGESFPATVKGVPPTQTEQ
jgi:hypothetical protein